MAKSTRPKRVKPIHDNGFGKFIKAMRHARGQTQEQLAEASDLAPDTIRRMEWSDFSPSLLTLMKVCKGLRIGLDALFVAFTCRRVGSEIELISIAQNLTASEARAAVRVLAIIADLVTAAAPRADAGGTDGDA